MIMTVKNLKEHCITRRFRKLSNMMMYENLKKIFVRTEKVTVHGYQFAITKRMSTIWGFCKKEVKIVKMTESLHVSDCIITSWFHDNLCLL